ncbi:hypothetical protein KY290_009687 [Solanum tuberosum]|uniref:Uncharacterized protein n=1 Tax=Solanum tuberosum TaxID=4113 RepID=A0ABQ7VWA1_SOLTU|nr:hypothetical protein KY284_009623 [Solanum tuberosum]KAH0772550.1 hypothetical protein KY290_009687 [Solanum tuberosum]
MELRRGPWTVEEDFILMNYISHHGEGRWNSLSRCAGGQKLRNICQEEQIMRLRITGELESKNMQNN